MRSLGIQIMGGCVVLCCTLLCNGCALICSVWSTAALLTLPSSLSSHLHAAAFLPNRVSLKDLLQYADAAMPEQTELDGELYVYGYTISEGGRGGGRMPGRQAGRGREGSRSVRQSSS